MRDETKESRDILSGQLLADRYRIGDVIAEGGMGVVYKASHILMKRDVAIKIIRSELLDNVNLIARFQQEAMAVSQLHHPNIVTVYDFGVTPEGMPYLVMDYLNGTNLSDLIHQQHKLPYERALGIIAQACGALQHAHEQGIIHRDFKASNLVVCKGPKDADLVKVIDFGMAKLVRPDGDNSAFQELTHSGEIFGSPLYMSPEQCRGQKLDVRSDIYSLGCVMYYALTGHPPLLGANVFDTLQKQINDIPLPPSKKDSSIASAIDSVVLKALRKDPDARYQSVADLVSDLALVSSGKDRLAVTAQFKRVELPKPPELHDSAEAAKPLELLTQSNRKRRLFSNLFESNLSFALVVLLAIISLTAFISGRAFEVADESVEANTWVDYNQNGNYARAQGNLFAAEKDYQQAVAEAVKFGKNDPRVAKSLVSLAAVYIDEHQFEKAEHTLARAQKVFETCYGPDCAELASVYLAMSEVYSKQGKVRDSEDMHSKALALLETSVGHKPSLARK